MFVAGKAEDRFVTAKFTLSFQNWPVFAGSKIKPPQSACLQLPAQIWSSHNLVAASLFKTRTNMHFAGQTFAAVMLV